MIATNNMIARVAAVVAGLGLVAMSFSAFAPAANAQSSSADLQVQIAALMAQIAALQAQAGASASSCGVYNRDLTIGSTGADVTALQTWLISNGFTIAAGATGYFGGQTQAALAKYQASVSITPPAGYFGPITRAKLGGSCTGTPGTGTGTGTGSGGLSGGEADLSAFELDSEESDGNEGEEDVEIATAEFDVEDGDVRVERVEVMASSTNVALETNPWDYFDRIALVVDGDEVAEIDASDRDEWEEEDSTIDSGESVYRLTFTGVDAVFEEGDTAQITIVADIASNIDTADLAQDIAFQVPNDGIRAVDSEGIQHYIGATDTLGDDASPDESVTFGFAAEETGDLQVSENSDDPDSTTLVSDDEDVSDDYTVFVFEIENNDDVDSLVTDIVIDVATTGSAIGSILDSATLVVDGDEYDGDINATGASVGTIDFDDIDVEVGGDDTVEFELVVTLKADATGTVTFSLDAADVTAEGVDSGDDSTVAGSADGETHTVALSGVMLEGTGKTASVNDDGTVGTFTLTFDVTALEDDAYIYNGADDTALAASTTGVHYLIYSGGTDLGATTSDSALLQSDADTSGAYYIVREGQTESFTLTVTMDPAGGTATALYYVELDEVLFDDVVGTAPAGGTEDDTTYTVPNESEFETGAVSIEAS